MNRDHMNIKISLEEMSTGDYFIVVRVQDRKIASLYLAGDKQFASKMLEVARQQIACTVDTKNPIEILEKVNLGLSIVKESKSSNEI